MRGYRKLVFGLAIGLPFLAASYHLILHAIDLQADIVAMGVAVGAMATGVCTVMGIFVYGNLRERK